MILTTVRMSIPPEKQEEAVQILNATAERTRAQMGCINCRIYRDEQAEGVLMVEEMWKSQEALDRHLRSDNYRKVLLVAEMATEAPEIHFRTVTESAGLEMIEKSRGVRKE